MIGERSAIGWPLKIKLLYHMLTATRTPTELAKLEGKHLSEVSRVLGGLRRDGLVAFTEESTRQRHYRATQEGYLLLYAAMRTNR